MAPRSQIFVHMKLQQRHQNSWRRRKQQSKDIKKGSTLRFAPLLWLYNCSISWNLADIEPAILQHYAVSLSFFGKPAWRDETIFTAELDLHYIFAQLSLSHSTQIHKKYSSDTGRPVVGSMVSDVRRSVTYLV